MATQMKAADTIMEEKEQDEKESESDDSNGVPKIGQTENTFMRVETKNLMEKDLTDGAIVDQPGIQSATLKKKNLNLQDNSNTDLAKLANDDEISQGESKNIMRNTT